MCKYIKIVKKDYKLHMYMKKFSTVLFGNWLTLGIEDVSGSSVIFFSQFSYIPVLVEKNVWLKKIHSSCS